MPDQVRHDRKGTFINKHFKKGVHQGILWIKRKLSTNVPPLAKGERGGF